MWVVWCSLCGWGLSFLVIIGGCPCGSFCGGWSLSCVKTHKYCGLPLVHMQASAFAWSELLQWGCMDLSGVCVGRSPGHCLWSLSLGASQTHSGHLDCGASGHIFAVWPLPRGLFGCILSGVLSCGFVCGLVNAKCVSDSQTTVRSSPSLAYTSKEGNSN